MATGRNGCVLDDRPAGHKDIGGGGDRGDGVGIQGQDAVSISTAIRSPAIESADGSPRGTGTHPASTPSGPARTLAAIAISATDRAIGPTWVRGSPSIPSDHSSSITPVTGISPLIGLRAARPQKCAGSRTLPPESVPIPSAEPPAAMIAASPPLLLDGVRARSWGFVRP